MRLPVRLATPIAAAALLSVSAGGVAVSTAQASTSVPPMTHTQTATPTQAKPAAKKVPAKKVRSLTTRVVGGKRIITDGTGRALYLFTKDVAGKPSACKADCLNIWPVAKATSTPKVKSWRITAKVGTVKSAAGKQVTINGHRAYFFKKDTQPRTAKGQGVKGVWYVFAPNGHLIKAKLNG